MIQNKYISQFSEKVAVYPLHYLCNVLLQPAEPINCYCFALLCACIVYTIKDSHTVGGNEEISERRGPLVFVHYKVI